MLISRKRELNALEKAYQSEGNVLCLLHGREGVGKTTLIREFIEDKLSMYYLAEEYSDKEQILAMKRNWKREFHLEAQEDSYEAILKSAVLKTTRKLIIVIDECTPLLKSGVFLKELAAIMEKTKSAGRLMVVLSTSDMQWAKEEKDKILGGAALFLKLDIGLTPFSFMDVVKMFPEYPMKDVIVMYSILGGVPDYLREWNQKISVEENIQKLILDKSSRFYMEAERFLKLNLRELAVYNTVLAAMADGNNCLNDLYTRTDFSRAKISVYLKNLSQIGVVEKLGSYDIGQNDPPRKGVYAFTDAFLHFWYKFVFPNLSYLEMGRPEYVYNSLIAPGLDDYIEEYFIRVCRQYMGLMNISKGLPIQYTKSGCWYGKEGKLDFLAKDEQGALLVCACKWQSEEMQEKDLEKLLLYLLKTGLEPDYYYLFSQQGFSQGLKQKADYVGNIHLIDLDAF